MSKSWRLELERQMVEQLIDQLNMKFTVFSPSRVRGASPELVLQPASTDKVNSFRSLLPPSSVILPHLFNERAPLARGRTQLLFGLSYEDVAGIAYLDKFMREPVLDPIYQKARSRYLVCGLDKKKPPTFGYDLYLRPVKNQWYLYLTSSSDKRITTLVETLFSGVTRNSVPPAKTVVRLSAEYNVLGNTALSDAISKSKGRRIWKDVADRCLACGICAYVCPLCFCFDHDHSISLNGESKKCRTWDSCMLADHSRIAGGNRFLPRLEDRVYNWYHHKFVRIPAEHPGYSGCIGCGRCRQACPAKIDLLEVASQVLHSYA